MERKSKIIVHFKHNGKEYEGFDALHPYFVVRDAQVESCHERYTTAYAECGYSGYDKAGKKGSGVACITNAIGLYRLGIQNPIPKVEP